MNFLVSASTDVGIKKDKNEDSYNIKLINTAHGSVVFAVVCDGMGGLSMGEVASSSLVMAFNEWVEKALPQLTQSGVADDGFCDEWVKLATEYNEKLKIYGAGQGVRLGTTLTAMLITGEQYYIVNVGDTRAYEIGGDITRLTKDHTVVAREMELGILTEEQARTDKRRSVLTQCVGASQNVYPDVFTGVCKPNTVYVICSDGFRNKITEDEIFEYLNPGVATSEEILKHNSEQLIELNKQRGETDNITVLSIRTVEDGPELWEDEEPTEQLP